MNIQARLQKLENTKARQGDRCACSPVEIRYLRAAQNDLALDELPATVCEHCGLEKLTVWMHTAGSGLTEEALDRLEARDSARWRNDDEH